MVKQMKYKDYLGNELEVGDEVVYMKVGYRWFERGTIVTLCPKKAIIQPFEDQYTTIQFYYQIIKVL